nr:hypothetical protein [Nostoc sp. 'Peltigera membranacea cyanobiont' 210A]
MSSEVDKLSSEVDKLSSEVDKLSSEVDEWCSEDDESSSEVMNQSLIPPVPLSKRDISSLASHHDLRYPTLTLPLER